MPNDINQVMLIGRITRDPELRQIQSGVSVVSFGLAVGRSYMASGERREETSFFDCTAWGKLAEIVANYTNKGKQVAVTGRLQQRSWEQDGQRRSKVEIVVENLQLLASPHQAAEPSQPAAQNWSSEPRGDYPPADDSIPF